MRSGVKCPNVHDITIKNKLLAKWAWNSTFDPGIAEKVHASQLRDLRKTLEMDTTLVGRIR